jgi:hypothetical protein
MKRPYSWLRGRRPLIALGIALETALISVLISGLGTTPAAAAATVTETAWIPLGCDIAVGPIDANNTYNGGIGVHMATALRATHAATLRPGETFSLTGVSAVQVVPPDVQAGGAAFGPVNGFEGILSDFESTLTNATSNFVPGSSNGGKQLNQVQALQPPNDDAASGGTGGVPDNKSYVSPDASDPSPLDVWADQGLSADQRRQRVFSFGPIPIKSDGSATGNAYGPAPGQDGGPSVTSGTPRPLGTGLTLGGPANHFAVNAGTGGQNVVLDAGDATRFVTNSIFGFNKLTFVGYELFSINDPTPPQKHQGTIPGSWSSLLDVACGLDTTPGALAPPAPGYCTNSPGTLPDVPAGCFVKTLTIPISAAGSPTITTQPTDQTVTDGMTATFIAEVSGSPTPTVQWQVSTDHGVTFTDLAGATSTTLKVPMATVAMSGNQYHAVFTNSVGTGTSDAATLTVNPSPASRPKVTEVRPHVGIAGFGGGVVFIRGRNLTGATSVKFASTPALSIMVVSDHLVLAIAPPEPSGTVDISVATVHGTSATSNADRFTYRPFRDDGSFEGGQEGGG